jgi:ATP-dependent RNA helicase RhlB
MVFVNTKAFVERVARSLERAGYRVGVLSGDEPQKKRESLLKKFQAGQLEILVATDVAARGLHIDGVSHVYNYDLPFDAEDYVHRIGRTARLGAEGDAISFACERYAISLPDIEAYIEQKIPVEPVTPDLLVALPRKPREVVAGAVADDDDGESVSQIFREAREQRAAEEERRGGGRSSGGGRSAGSGTHGAGASRGAGGEARRERSPRPPRKPQDVAAAPVQVAAPVPAAAIVSAPGAEGEHGPRKRRRRRGGKRIEGVEAGSQQAGSQQAASQPAKASKDTSQARGGGRHPVPAPRPETGATGESSLLSRIGRGLKSLVTRAPRSQH